MATTLTDQDHAWIDKQDQLLAKGERLPLIS